MGCDLDLDATAYRSREPSTCTICKISSALRSLHTNDLQTSGSAVFANASLRQTLHLSVGGDTFRIHISNAFGTTNLPITAVTIALPATNTAGIHAIKPETLKNITFNGASSYTVPSGALVVSDPIELAIPAQGIVTVSIYLAQGQQSNNITSHPGSRTTSWMVGGNQINATSFSGSGLASVAHW